MAGVTEDDVRKAIDYVKKKNAGFLKQPTELLDDVLSKAPNRAAVEAAAGKLKEFLETYNYREMLEPEVEAAAGAARETLEALKAEAKSAGKWGKLDEESVRRIQESLDRLKASMPEYPDFDRVYARVARTPAGKGVSKEDCKKLYDRIIQERREKAATTKRGRPLLLDQKKPTRDDVQKIVNEKEEAEGLFPESGPVLAEAKGTREVGKKHYAAIREERERAAGPELRKLDKRIQSKEDKRDEAIRKAEQLDADLEALQKKRRILLKEAKHRSTMLLPGTMMLPGSAALGGYEAALRALDARIAAVKAARDAALRRVEELEAALRAQA